MHRNAPGVAAPETRFLTVDRFETMFALILTRYKHLARPANRTQTTESTVSALTRGGDND